MSIYTSQIKTHIIDPVYNAGNFRAEYRLEPDTVYLSNMRIVGLGAVGTGGTTPYSSLVGANGVIRQISLYDDNQLLDQLLEVPHFLSFKNLNNSNQDNMDLNQNLNKNELGNIWSGLNDVTGVGQQIFGSILANSRGVCDVAQPNAPANATATGWLDLKRVFPLLRNLTSIPTTFFKNLKVVVEYNTDPELYISNTQRAPYTTTEAQLIADEVVGDMGKQKLGGFQGVSYTSIEHDRVNIPRVGQGNNQPLVANTVDVATQSQTLHINGFNNKTVGRMLIQKAPTEPTSYLNGTQLFRYGKTGSKAFNKEALQVRVNGSSIIAGKGIVGANQRLGMLNDVWGNLSLTPFSNGEAYLSSDADNRNNFINDGNPSISNLDYYGININNKVEDLQIDFERQAIYLYTSSPVNAGNDNTATNISDNNQAINLNIFCEVYKQIVPSAGGYNVVYV